MATRGWYSSLPRGPDTGFNKNCIYILDGGFAVQASKYVSEPDKEIYKNPLWTTKLTVSQPDVVRKVHQDYLRAGAQIITTNTYQSSVELLTKHIDFDLPQLDSAKVYGASVKLADEAIENVFDGCHRFAMVAGAVGPYGASLDGGDDSEYVGNYVDTLTREELREWHRERIQRLAGAGVDFLAVETIPSVKEACG